MNKEFFNNVLMFYTKEQARSAYNLFLKKDYYSYTKGDYSYSNFNYEPIFNSEADKELFEIIFNKYHGKVLFAIAYHAVFKNRKQPPSLQQILKYINNKNFNEKYNEFLDKQKIDDNNKEYDLKKIYELV